MNRSNSIFLTKLSWLLPGLVASVQPGLETAGEAAPEQRFTVLYPHILVV